MLRLAGLSIEDSRLRRSRDALLEAEQQRAPKPVVVDIALPKPDFCKAIRHDILLIERALQGNMVVPDFDDFCRDIDGLHAPVRAQSRRRRRELHSPARPRRILKSTPSASRCVR